MAKGTIKCAVCGKPCDTPNALWSHVRLKAQHGCPEHQDIYSENGFEEETEETVEEEESGGNLLEEWKENTEEDDMTEDVKQLESPEEPADKPDYRKIKDIDTEELPNEEVKKALAAVIKENPDAEIEVNTDKNWLKRDIR